MPQTAPKERAKLRIFWVAMLSLPVLLLLLLYLASVIARGGVAYYQFKTRHHSWAGQAWRADARLGYAHVPGFEGRQSLAPDVSQALVLDENGFRVPAGARAADAGGPKLLSLGGSFTFGVGVEAEETYTELVARGLGGVAHNAGVNGYGLGQMILQARTLLDEHAPDILLVSYGPWLGVRGGNRYSETRLAAIPTPYVVGEDGGRARLAPPLFRPRIFDLDLGRYWAGPAGIGNFLGYMARGAVPLFLHDDVQRSAVWLKDRVGAVPRSLDDRLEIVRLAYDEIAALAAAAGARLYVAEVSSWAQSVPEELALLAGRDDLTFVPTRELQWSRLAEPSQELFYRTYAHWAGEPPVMVDMHPNALAHRIFAEEILKAIAAEASGR